MSYEIVISRGYRCAEDGSFSEILIEEWNHVITEKNLVPIEFFDGINPVTKETIRISLPNSARIGEDGPLLVWKKGVIGINADEAEFDTCRPIADALGAKIYGEEGETY